MNRSISEVDEHCIDLIAYLYDTKRVYPDVLEAEFTGRVYGISECLRKLKHGDLPLMIFDVYAVSDDNRL